MRPIIDWEIEDRNTDWHDQFFTKKATQDHQAKGNCSFVWRILEYMEEREWLKPGDIVLDPMCGIASFLVVAALKGYDCIGVELEKKYYNDIVGYDEEMTEDTFFGGHPVHVQGVLEKFREVTRPIEKVGRILVYNGDARDLKKVFESRKIWLDAKEPPPQSFSCRVNVVCSPPYGNDFADETQSFGSKDSRSFDELDTYNQYGGSDNNIGQARIKVVCSPPYAFGSNEHKDEQISYVDDYTGQKTHEYSDPRNIASLAKDDDYRREMRKVYKSLYQVLQPGSVVCLITRNFIQGGKIVGLDRITRICMEKFSILRDEPGFKYLETKRGRLPDVSFFKNVNYQKFHKAKGLPLIDWEEAQFFIKE